MKLPEPVLKLVRKALVANLGSFWDNPTITAWVVRRVAYEAVCFSEVSDIATCEGRAFLVALVAGFLIGKPVLGQPTPTTTLALGEEVLAGWGHDTKVMQRDFWVLSRYLFLALGKLLPGPGVS